MADTAAWPVTGADVAAYVGTGTVNVHDQAAKAASAWVERFAPAFRLSADGKVSESVRLGTLMLAHRWSVRKASPGGVLSFEGMGATYIQRQDPDVATMLGLVSVGVG